MYYFMRYLVGYLALTITTTLLLSCGSTRPLLGSRSHTLGGMGSSFREFPGYIVKIDVQIDHQSKHSATCSGVHIGDGVILTAAHCLIHNLDQKLAPTKWIPKLYNFDQITYLSQREIGAPIPRHLTAGEIVMAVYHHNIPNSHPDSYDIAVIFTKPKIPFDDAALLPDKDYTHQPRAVDVYGVGLSFTDLYHFPNYHRYFSGQASIDVESRHNIETTTLMPPMSFFISTWIQPEPVDSAISAIAIKGICPGDSGGPVVLHRPESHQDMVIGTLSHINLLYILFLDKLKELSNISSDTEGCFPFIAVNHLFEYLPWLKEVTMHYQKIHHNLNSSGAISTPITLSSEELKSLATNKAN